MPPNTMIHAVALVAAAAVTERRHSHFSDSNASIVQKFSRTANLRCYMRSYNPFRECAHALSNFKLQFKPYDQRKKQVRFGLS